MLRAVMTEADTGRPIVLLGLTPENLTRMTAGEPIRVNFRRLAAADENIDLPDVTVIVAFDDGTLQAQLEAATTPAADTPTSPAEPPDPAGATAGPTPPLHGYGAAEMAPHTALFHGRALTEEQHAIEHHLGPVDHDHYRSDDGALTLAFRPGRP